MIQIDFSSGFIDKDIAKLSVISDADSFVYGLFDNSHQMVSRGKVSSENVVSFVRDWEKKGASIYYMSPSPAFTHVPVSEKNSFNETGLQKDEWTEDGIICFYQDPFLPKFNWNYKHISTACFPFLKHKKGPRIWLHFREKSIQLAGVDNGNFLFFNEFEIQTAEDVIYYLFAVSRQVFLAAPDEIPVEFSGQLTVNSSFYQLIYRYIRHFEPVRHADFRTLNEEIADHVYFDHFLNIQDNAHH